MILSFACGKTSCQTFDSTERREVRWRKEGRAYLVLRSESRSRRNTVEPTSSPFSLASVVVLSRRERQLDRLESKLDDDRFRFDLRRFGIFGSRKNRKYFEVIEDDFGDVHTDEADHSIRTRSCE